MPKMLAAFLAFVLVCAAAGTAMVLTATPARSDNDTLYQVSTLDSLSRGHFKQVTTVQDLLGHGNVGLGTFTGLNGEMIVLDGRCYQATVDGTVKEAPGSDGVPFAQVAYFARDGALDLNGRLNLSGAEARIAGTLPSDQLLYVLRIDGTFDDVTVRSVPSQQEPYPPLADVVANQTVFRYAGISGTMIGVWTPSSVSGSSAGFHFHFVSADRSKGGHVLDFDLSDLSVQWDRMTQYTVQLAS